MITAPNDRLENFEEIAILNEPQIITSCRLMDKDPIANCVCHNYPGPKCECQCQDYTQVPCGCNSLGCKYERSRN
ncbi:hypothetical protein J4218_04190 [Candidatus Pacearchaeota archaeon]|nr:hypothetical protein [Candidatus Pacearchaeota archaeon]